MVELSRKLAEANWQPYQDDTFLGHVGNIFVREDTNQRHFAILTQSKHRNLSGRLHGGVFMTLMDRVMGETLRAAQPGVAYATAQMNTEFMRPVEIGALVEVRAEIIRIGRTAVNMRSEAYAGGKIVASATALFLRAAGTTTGTTAQA